MPFGLLTAGISGLAGFFGGQKQQKTQTNGTITNNGSTTGNTNQNLTNNLSPFQQQLASTLTRGSEDLYNSSTDLKPYTASGISQINANSDLTSKILDQTLASRGLTYSPAAAVAKNQNTISRVGQVSNFENSIPLLQRQLQTQALSGLDSAFSVLPTDRSVTGNTSSTTNNTQTQQGTNLVSGNPAAGLTGGLGAGLAAANVNGGLGDWVGGLFGNGGNSGGNNGGIDPSTGQSWGG